MGKHKVNHKKKNIMGKHKKKNTRAKKKEEKENRNMVDLPQQQQAKDTIGKNFLTKENIEAQHPSLNKKMKDEEISPKETKDYNVLVEAAEDYDDVLGDEDHDVLVEKAEEYDVLDQDKDKIHQAIIGFCVDHLEEMGSIETAQMLEKESGYFNWGHFNDLVQRGAWKLLEDYLSHFFDIGESAFLTKIETWAFMDDLKRQCLPLPEPQWVGPDHRQASIIFDEAFIQGKLKMRDEIKLPQESDLQRYLIWRMKDDVAIEDNTGSDHLDQDQDNDKIHQAIIRFFVGYFDDMGFTETSRMLEKKSGYFNETYFKDLVRHGRWKLLEDYLSHFFDIGESALLSTFKTWAFMDDLKTRGLPLPQPEWFEPDYKQKESIISALPELIQGKLKTRDELKLAQESDLWRSLIWSSRLTYEGSDLVGVHRRPPEERKLVYKNFEKMTVFHKILGEDKCTKVREGVYENKPAMIKCIDLHGEVAIHQNQLSKLIALEGDNNIVKYYGEARDKDSYFIALEKCSFSLHDLFDKEKNYGIEIKSTWDCAYPPPTMLLSLIKNIIKGVEYLHSHDLIHRGLNPSNIMIKEECSKFCAKLSNMGLSKRLEGASSTTNTPNDPTKSLDDDKWKAPEQKKKEKKVGRYVDLYSLGFIIHFCLTQGKHPWDVNPTNNQEKCSIKQQLSMLVKKFPEAYDIVSQLMSPEKNKRPAAKQVLKHPFFWNPPKRNDFMRHASDWLDKEREDQKKNNTKSHILAKLKSKKGYIFVDRWDDKIDADFVTYLQENDPHIKFDSVFTLVRVIRNKSGHFLDLPENVKDLIPGRSADGLEEYFVRRFPKLLLEVYKVVLEFWKDEPTFQRYFA